MKRLPLIPTLVVGLAVAAMVALGIWQLRRADWKEGLIARYQANANRPPMAFPTTFPIGDDVLFRRAEGFCLKPVTWSVEAGRSRSGKSGWRHIAGCWINAWGPGLTVDVGVSSSMKPPPWRGGGVHGRIVWAPQHYSIIERAIGMIPAPIPMIVSDIAAPGLEPSAPPSPADIPNNHRGYAVQWFLFAAVALVIYVLALRRRQSPRPTGERVGRGAEGED